MPATALLDAVGSPAHVVDDAVVAAFHRALLANPYALALLFRRRGITRESVEAYEIGWNEQNGRYTIPVRDPEGRCVNVRQYKLDARDGEPKMISWRPGFGAARLYPGNFDASDDGPVVICEGELDAILARQQGLNAATSTGGASTWRSEWNHRLRGHDVVVCYDADLAGDDGSRGLARQLHGVASSVRVHSWPEGSPRGFDVTDFFVQGGDAAVLRARFDAAPEWTPPPDDPPSAGDPGAEMWTDLGNAEQFAARFGGELRHVRALGWFAWDGSRWGRDETGAVDRLAMRMARERTAEANAIEDEDRRRKALAWARQSESRQRILSMVALAASILPIAAPPDAFDADPWLLNTPGGTVDLRTGALRPHRREDMLSKCTRVAPDPARGCPRWLAFLDRVFAGRAALVDYVQRAVGYSLTGSTQEHALFILWGTGANGKSTLLELLLHLLADYATAAEFRTLGVRRGDGPREDLAQLVNLRLVSAAESGEKQAFDEPQVKRVTGGDTIRVRHLYRPSFEHRPTYKFWIATNKRPRVDALDPAIWRRLQLIPFTVTIPEAERDRGLLDKLRDEAPAVLAWAIDGCRAYLRDGLNPPPEVVAATAEYREDMDRIGPFLAARAVADERAATDAKALYDAYRQWAEESGEEPATQTAFGTMLTDKGFAKDRRGPGKSTRRLGIRLLTPMELAVRPESPGVVEDLPQW